VGGDTARLVRSREQLARWLNDLREVAGKTADDRCAGALPAGVIEGVRLFNERAFYECHETIEQEWHAERGAIRQLYQGVLQIGVGFHHALHGNHRGALLLLRDGIEKSARFVPACRGIDTGRLVTESTACLETLTALGVERLAEFDSGTIPTIHQVRNDGGMSAHRVDCGK
jgi:predicted metal-dependent hydrolase